jgi:hypothetical protein
MSRGVSLTSLLQERACRQPDVTAYTFIDYDVDPIGLAQRARLHRGLLRHGRPMRTALEVDGPSVVSIECAADEIPPLATFLGPLIAKNDVYQNVTKENTPSVAFSA